MVASTYEELQQENRRLRERLASLEQEQLRARVSALEAENAHLREENTALRDRLAQAQEKKDPPPFIKPRRQAQEPKPPHKVAEELLGEEFSGAVSCDFFSAYNPLGVSKQRCWAHLLRETRELEGEEGQQLHQELKELRTWIEGKLGRAPPLGHRERLARFGEWAVHQLTEREWSDPQCRRITARLRKEELFTFVRHPGVEATNNGAERALRPYVVKRKISGGHRSWAGASKHTILLSVLETCRRRGEDFRALVEGVLRQAIASAG